MEPIEPWEKWFWIWKSQHSGSKHNVKQKQAAKEKLFWYFDFLHIFNVLKMFLNIFLFLKKQTEMSEEQ